MGRAPPGQRIKAARGVICAFVRTRERAEVSCAPHALPASARQLPGCRPGRGAEASGGEAVVPWGCAAARTGEDTCERPKVTPGAHVRRAAAAGITPAGVPSVCGRPHLPRFAGVSRLLTLVRASCNSGTLGGRQGYARSNAAWGSRRSVGWGAGPSSPLLYQAAGIPRSTAVAGGSPTPPARPAPATPLRLNRPEGAGPFILTRLCHRLGLSGPDSRVFQSRSGTCEQSCFWNAAGLERAQS